MRLRTDGADLVLCDLAHDIGWLIERLTAERIACPVIACGRNADAAAAVRAIQAGAKSSCPAAGCRADRRHAAGGGRRGGQPGFATR